MAMIRTFPILLCLLTSCSTFSDFSATGRDKATAAGDENMVLAHWRYCNTITSGALRRNYTPEQLAAYFKHCAETEKPISEFPAE